MHPRDAHLDENDLVDCLRGGPPPGALDHVDRCHGCRRGLAACVRALDELRPEDRADRAARRG